MFTEQEANEKLCPLFAISVFIAAHAQASATVDNLTCNASKCMMWFWDICESKDGVKLGKGHCGLVHP